MGFRCSVPNLQNPNRSKINLYYKIEGGVGKKKIKWV